MRTLADLVVAAGLAFSGTSASAQEAPTKTPPVVSYCEVVQNPGSYDGKAISVRAKVSREFEDFTLFDGGWRRQ